MANYRKYNDYEVEIFSDEEIKAGRIKCGRGLLNEVTGRFSFVTAPPRGARNKLVARTKHFTLMKRPDGTFSGIFRFDISKKYVESELVAEIRNMIDYATKNDVE